MVILLLFSKPTTLTTRVVIISSFTFLLALLTAVMSVMEGTYFLGPLSLCFIGVYLIGKNLWGHTQFKLVNNELVVKEPIQNAISFDMKGLISWEEISYNIRGQRKKTLVLFLEREKKLIVSNEDYKNEFEYLFAHLEKNYSDLKKSDD